jgi:serine/threonine-protein phosphatase 2B catalytic subunit
MRHSSFNRVHKLKRDIHREDTESSSELKNVTGAANPDPHGPLASGSEGIKESITNFTDARKSDIDNEHLPPDLIDPTDAESLASSIGDDSFDSTNASIMGGEMSSSPSSPTTPETPGHSPRTSMSGSGDYSNIVGSPGSVSGSRFKKGHGRQSSLGTTMTSPSTRRRSLENTISMIREAMTKDTTQMGSSFVLATKIRTRWLTICMR